MAAVGEGQAPSGRRYVKPRLSARDDPYYSIIQPFFC
jgi:hypothetical protein